MERVPAVTAACWAVVLTSACDPDPTGPEGAVPPRADVVLDTLGFASAEIEVGDALVLIGRTEADPLDTQPFLLRTSSGESVGGHFNPRPEGRRSAWAPLSDEELAAVIATRDDRVIIGFKEADADQGTDEQGRNITSDETVDRMKAWVREQGITITFESAFIPAIAGRMDPDVQGVTAIRWHENVDYFEPVGKGHFEDPDGPTLVLRFGDLVAAILTSGDGPSAVEVQPGDLVTAHYRQPDGSELTATARVRR